MDRNLYQGRFLAFLLLAFCGPSALLFLRILLGHAAAEPGVTSAQMEVFTRWSAVLLAVYLAAQIVAVWYMSRMIPSRKEGRRGTTALLQVLQLGGLLITSVLVSIVGAVMLEAFGYSLYLQFRRH